MQSCRVYRSAEFIKLHHRLTIAIPGLIPGAAEFEVEGHRFLILKVGGISLARVHSR